MSTAEFLAISFISKLKVLRHNRWLKEMNDEYDSLRSSLDEDDELTDEIWLNSQRPPLIRRQSGESIISV